MVTPSVILIVIELELVQNTPRTWGGITPSNNSFNLTVGLRASLLNTIRSTWLTRLPSVRPNIGRPHLRITYYYEDTFLTKYSLLLNLTHILLVCSIPQAGSGRAADAQGRYKRLSLKPLTHHPSTATTIPQRTKVNIWFSSLTPHSSTSRNSTQLVNSL